MLTNVILLIVINSLLMLWEVLQLISSGFSYFNFWNYLDNGRSVITITWSVLQLYQIQSFWLCWFVVLLNIIRGVSGFRAFDRTRFYVKLIFESLLKITFFLFIFIYTTLSFGLLHMAAQTGSEVSIESIWIDSFGLAIGNSENMNSKSFDIKYLTLLLAVVVNIVLMMNMIISLLGDSFDEFQLLSVYYDNKEMTEIILEIEQIASLYSPIEMWRYLHICENYYLEEDQNWKGKIVDARVQFKNSIGEIEKNVNGCVEKLTLEINALENQINIGIGSSGKIIEENLKTEIAVIGNSLNKMKGDVMLSQANTNKSINELQVNINGVEKRINNVEEKISSVDAKLESILSLLSK